MMDDANIIPRTIKLPKSLQTRSGWSNYLDAKRSSEPHVHQIEPTNHCPYSCVMCPRSEKMTRDTGFMEWDLYASVIDEIAGFSTEIKEKEIELFHFGESLLHPKLPEMISYGSSKGLKMTLSINAPQLNETLSSAILKASPFRIIISLDGHNDETYKKIRGSNANYNKARSEANKLIELAKQTNQLEIIQVRMILMHSNQDQAEDFTKYWTSKGVQAELREFFPWGEEELVELGVVEKLPSLMPCPFPWQYVVVQWNGDVVPCCRDYNAVNAIANVKDKSLKEIWNSDAYEGFRSQHRTGDYADNAFCRKCMDIYYDEGSKV